MAQEKSSKNKAWNLRWLAEATGADFLRGAKKYQNFRQVVTRDLNNYYLISFYPQRKEADGQYHKIEVKVKRPGIKVNHREGYTDYTEEGTHNLKLLTAFYNPSFFTQIPLKAEFIPFYGNSRKCESWVGLALPAKEFFIDRFVEYGPKTYDLHIWIADWLSGQKRFGGGKIKLPFHLDEAFMEFIKGVDYINMNFRGSKLNLESSLYQAVFALVDPVTGEIGTFVSSFLLPDLEKEEKGEIVSCVLGQADAGEEENRPLALSPQEGHLEFGPLTFLPRITGIFDQLEWAYIFLQCYAPEGKETIHPEFTVTGEDKQIQSLTSQKEIHSYNLETKIWSGIFALDTSLLLAGDYTLTVIVPHSSDNSVMKKNLRLKIHNSL
jgi:hypothetical protein